jgi:hypothetical protein
MTALPPCEWLNEPGEGCEDPDSTAAWEQASLDGDCTPALARRFHITDPQHWLDLCA